MPYDNGVYTLPDGTNPVLEGETIESAWANTFTADIQTSLNQVITKDDPTLGDSLRLIDGSISSPGLTWQQESSSGLYRAGGSDFRYSIVGADVIRINPAGLSWWDDTDVDPAEHQWEMYALVKDTLPITGGTITGDLYITGGLIVGDININEGNILSFLNTSLLRS